MRLAGVPVALVTIILLIAVPVGGAPPLQVGSSATYNDSIRVSFSPPFCETSTTGSQTDLVYCPLEYTNLPGIEVRGTLGWTATGLNTTTAVLNVTRDLSTFLAGNFTTPLFMNTSSFNESINLANRTISIMPFIIPEMDQALQSMSSWTTSMSTMSSAMWIRHPSYTMWWVNGPLKLNDTVPVLVFPTNVTGLTSMSLGNIGTRTAWTLTYNLTLPSPEQATTYSMPSGDSIFPLSRSTTTSKPASYSPLPRTSTSASLRHCPICQVHAYHLGQQSAHPRQATPLSSNLESTSTQCSHFPRRTC
jgi:hypothetical protein